jgi:hypothetical protein
MSREASSKDSSNEEDILAEGFDSNGVRDRRVTFRADRRLELVRGATVYPLRKCASASFQSSSMEKRLRMTTSHEN